MVYKNLDPQSHPVRPVSIQNSANLDTSVQAICETVQENNEANKNEFYLCRNGYSTTSNNANAKMQIRSWKKINSVFEKGAYIDTFYQFEMEPIDLATYQSYSKYANSTPEKALPLPKLKSNPHAKLTGIAALL